MFAVPGTLPDFTHKFTREAAQRVASNWWKLLLNGAILIVAGVLIFSIDWNVRSLATFIGPLFIVDCVMMSLLPDRETARAGARRHSSAPRSGCWMVHLRRAAR